MEIPFFFAFFNVRSITPMMGGNVLLFFVGLGTIIPTNKVVGGWCVVVSGESTGIIMGPRRGVGGDNHEGDPIFYEGINPISSEEAGEDEGRRVHQRPGLFFFGRASSG